MRIAISTGGGDAPGLNAVIRAAVLSALNRGWEVVGIKRGFSGLLGEDEVVTLTKESVRGIAHLGERFFARRIVAIPSRIRVASLMGLSWLRTGRTS